MNKYRLPTSVTINDKECKIDYDFRNIIEIMGVLNDPDLIEPEKVLVSLSYFYEDATYTENLEEAVRLMFWFISMEDPQEATASAASANTKNDKPLYDWQQDFDIIIAPVNRILGYDCRGVDVLHWWTFLSAFMEIGECTFNTYVGIRNKLNHHKKLEKWEEKIYKEHKDKILLKKKYDSTTQSIIDEIMGRK